MAEPQVRSSNAGRLAPLTQRLKKLVQMRYPELSEEDALLVGLEAACAAFDGASWNEALAGAAAWHKSTRRDDP